MAKQLIPEELDALIQEYLTDGVLSDKERKVILNKAVNMGLDYDEIDLYLDAQEQKIEQSIDAAVRKQKGKTCPYCGGSVPQLADKCPNCDEHITPEASDELKEIFDNLEDALVDYKSGKDIHKSKATVERYARKAKMYYGNNPKVQKLLEELEVETSAAEKKAKAIARNSKISNVASNVFTAIGALLLLFVWDHKKLATAIVIILVCLPVCNWVYRTVDGKISLDKQQLERVEREKGSDEAKEFNDRVVRLINDGDLEEACIELVGLTPPSGVSPSKLYDATYMKACKALIKNNDFDAAEEVGLAFKAIISSDSTWYDTSTYGYLKSSFKTNGVDFSAMKSKYDEDID